MPTPYPFDDVPDDVQPPESAPWTRRDDETDAQFLAFRIYRDLGERRTLAECNARYRLARAGEEYQPGDVPADALDVPDGATRRIEHWSSGNDWTARVAAFDDWRDRVRTLAGAGAVFKIAADCADAATERVRESDFDPKTVSRLARALGLQGKLRVALSALGTLGALDRVELDDVVEALNSATPFNLARDLKGVHTAARRFAGLLQRREE